ncbi:hypothetical protein FHB04_22715 [Escherichia coli]|nr:hypothetical protein [Escherichia coli]
MYDGVFEVLQWLLFLSAVPPVQLLTGWCIKIFSVVSVVFLPPTLVASSYGMNFEFMPELKWSFGYPGAIIFMILAGLAPYLYFKRKNWL